METACDVYTKLLFQRGHGHPLWEPEPTAAGEVLIGDVGHIYNGAFYRLFNATLPPDHPVHQRYGVPEGYVPFTYPDCLYQYRSHALAPGPLCSKNVLATSVEGSLAAGWGATAGGRMRFKCTDEQGAVLVLKQEGNRESLLPCRTLTQYILCNHQRWHQFAQDVFMLDIREEDVIFVRGSVKTGEWALAAVTHGSRDGEMEFSGDFGGLAKAAFTVGTRKEMYMSVEHRVGPMPDSRRGQAAPTWGQGGGVKFDQCVFLHYYKVKRRMLFGPKVMRAAAEAQDDDPAGADAQPGAGVPSSGGPELGEDMGGDVMEVEEVPHATQAANPMDCLLDFILGETNATRAIVSDADVATWLSEHSADTPAGTLSSQQLSLYIDEDGVAMLPIHARPFKEHGFRGTSPGSQSLDWHEYVGISPALPDINASPEPPTVSPSGNTPPESSSSIEGGKVTRQQDPEAGKQACDTCAKRKICCEGGYPCLQCIRRGVGDACVPYKPTRRARQRPDEKHESKTARSSPPQRVASRVSPSGKIHTAAITTPRSGAPSAYTESAADRSWQALSGALPGGSPTTLPTDIYGANLSRIVTDSLLANPPDENFDPTATWGYSAETPYMARFPSPQSG